MAIKKNAYAFHAGRRNSAGAHKNKLRDKQEEQADKELAEELANYEEEKEEGEE